VAKALNLPCYETPTGWKFFGSLLDAGAITLCGEESAGAGSDHIREKDGVWAILFWLNLVAARGLSVREIVEDHWRRFGRHACVRLDYDGLPTDRAEALMSGLTARLGELAGVSVGGETIAAADMFNYVDPINGATAKDQGVRLYMASGGRVVFRLSGTGTTGATLRVYLEQFEKDPSRLSAPAGELVAPLERLAMAVAQIADFTGRSEPSARV
jgi:phosphoglucomutase